MRFARLYRTWMIAGLGGCLTSATACNQNVDLTAVKQFAETTATASTTFNAMAADFAASCRRRRALVIEPRYLAHVDAPLAPAYRKTPPPLPATPAPSAVPIPGPATAPATSSPYDDPAALVKASRTLSDCLAEDGISREWQNRNDVVLGYVRSLGALANLDDVPSFAALDKPLVAAHVITAAQDTAFANLLKAIALSETRAGQEDAIAHAAVAAKQPLREAVSALKRVSDSYANVLDAEYQATFSLHKQIICDDLRSVAHLPPLGAVDRCELPVSFPAVPAAARERVRQETLALTEAVRVINEKRKGTIGYANALDTLVSTNDDLAASATKKPGIGDIVKIVNKHLVDLVKAVGDVQKAVK